ncbi:MAG: AraC family ligand binding domain-containing protein, partial [Phycisphaeraceae bacterium]|nr:AraC family ligand binding domain-containing protein [Phycisphaeraceae bacterium]
MKSAASEIRQISFEHLVSAGEKIHVARHTLGAKERIEIHRHDFSEVFWVESGRGRHDLNGQSHPLESGQLVWIRPTDIHRLVGGDGGMTYTNVAMAQAALDRLRQALVEPVGRYWPWTADEASDSRVLDGATLGRTTAWARHLASGRRDEASMAWFVLNLLEQIDLPLPGLEGPMPDWLRRAMRGLADPSEMAGGTSALARLAGRSPEHVNRTARRVAGCTATDLVNAVRMGWAGRELAMTDRPVLEI